MKVTVSESTFRQIQRISRIRGVPRKDAAQFLLELALRRDTAPADRPGEERTIDVAYSAPVIDPDLAARLLEAEAPRLPRKVRPSDRPVPDPYDIRIGEHEASISDGHRTFCDSTTASGRDARALEYVADLQPDGYTPLHQKLHERFTQRYRKYLDNPDRWFIPRDGAVAVDAGAYVGYKAVALHDVMGAGSKIIAVEMMLPNYLLLERNVRANGLADAISTHPYALAAARGVHGVASLEVGNYSNSLADVERFEGLDRIPIQTFTLADVLDLHDVDQVDYLNVQVNGAELAALRGLGRWWGRVRRAFVACPYIGAQQNEVRALLVEHGMKVAFEKPGLIVADD